MPKASVLALLLILEASVFPSLSPAQHLQLPGIPSNPIASGCAAVMDTLGYTCPVAEGDAPELLQIPPAFRRSGGVQKMVLSDFPGWPREGKPEANFTVPDTWLEVGSFLDTAWFRERGIETLNLPTSLQNFIFPIFYSRVNERWEPLEDCGFLAESRVVRCRPNIDIFRKHTGLTLLMVSAMSETRAAVLGMLQNSMRPAPSSKICLPSHDMLSMFCPSTIVHAEAVRYGRASLRSAMMECNHPLCFVFPANMAHFYQGGCVYGFSKRCGSIDPVTGKDVCCPMHDLQVTATKKMWDIVGSWSDSEDNTSQRRHRFGVGENFGFNIRPHTFSKPESSGVVMLDSMSAPDDMPFPHPVLVIGSIVNIAFEDVPSKPFEVVFNDPYQPQSYFNTCGKDKIYQSTAMSVFYYDTPTRRWVSVPIRGNDTVGSFFFNETSRVATATIPPRVAIRNNLSVFLGILSGIPILPNGEHLTAQFFLPPTGLRKSDMYREGWQLPSFSDSVGCNILFPVKASSLEVALLSRESSDFVLVGSPGGLQLTEVPAAGYPVSVFVDPALLVHMQQQRRLLATQLSPVQVYFFSNGSWAPLDGCAFNTTTSSIQCVLQPAFFEKYGLNVTIANVANRSSQVAAILQQDGARAAWLEAQDLATLAELFRAQLLPPHNTTTTTTAAAGPTATPPPPPPPPPEEPGDSPVSWLAPIIIVILVVVGGVVTFLACKFAYAPRQPEKLPPPTAAETMRTPLAPAAYARLSSRVSFMDVQIPVLDADLGRFLQRPPSANNVYPGF